MYNNKEETMTSEELLKLIGIQHAYEYIETAEQKIKDIIKLENEIGDTKIEGLLFSYISKRYSAFHFIGMGFEILYKTAILMEGGSPTWRHKLSILHEELKTSKEGFSKIITEHGWKKDEDFISYLDEYFTDPSIKYFDGYLVFKDRHQHPLQLIKLFYKLSHFVVDNANKNNVSKPSRWSPPIRLLSKP